MKNFLSFLIIGLMLSACTKKADVNNMPGIPKNIRPDGPVTTTPGSSAELEWSTPFVSFTPTAVNTTKEQVVTLKNKGTGASSPILLTWGDTDSPFSVKTGTNDCDNQILQPGQTCSLTIQYQPLLNGARSNILMATDLIVAKTLIMNGQGTGGTNTNGTSNTKLVWILDDYGFGPTAVGGNKTFDLILANLGGTTSQPIDISLQNTGTDFSIVPGFNFCQNQVLAPGANCKVRAKFNPTAAGNFTNIINATDSLETVNMNLTGSGIVISSQLSFNPTSYSFNQVLIGGQKTLDVKLRNNATVNSGVINLSWANISNYSIVSGLDQCSGQILPGGSECTIRIRFAPTVDANDLTNVLTADDTFSSATVSFIGNGADPASLLPVAFDQSLTVVEDIVFNGTLTGSDPQGLGTTFVITSNPSKGQLTLLNSNTGEFRYTPDMNQNGTDTFTFRVKNSNNEVSAVSTITLNIMPINDPPVVYNDADSVAEDSFKNVNVLANDIDVEGNPLTVMSVTQPGNGTTLVNGDYTIRYTPKPNFFGTDTFTYVVSDGAGGTGSALVTVTVTPVNDAPIAANINLIINEDAAISSHLQGTDVDSNLLSYSIVTAPTNGNIVITNSANGAFTYTPNANYNGTDTLTYKVNDGSLDSNTATVTFTVNSVNDIPLAKNSVLNVVEDVAKAFILDSEDSDSDTLTYVITTPPAHGTLSGTAPNLTYTPETNYHGMDTISFKVNDGTVDSNVATISVMVWAQNDAPVAYSDNLSIDEDSGLASSALTATDVDGDTLTYSIASQPTKGVLVLTNPATGSYTYTPNANVNGTDSFTFKVFDGTAESNIATIDITINSVDDLPVANDMNIQSIQDTTYSGLFNFTNIDILTLTFEVVTNAAHGTVTITDPATGDFNYVPNSGYAGTDSFTYRIVTDSGNSNTATVSISVPSSNTAPVANNASITVTEDVVFNGNFSATDAESNPLNYSVVSQGTKGIVSVNSTTGAYSYTPTLNVSGSDSFTFRVYDGLAYSNTATITVTINSVNDAPVVNNLVLNTNEETAVGVTLSGTDIESNPLTYTVVVAPTNGTLSGTAPNLTYTPNANYSGNDSFTYKANDGTSDSNVATVNISVTNINDLPVANIQTITTNEDTLYSGTLVATDADNNTLSYSVVAQGTKGTVSITNVATGAFTYTPNLNQNGSDSFTFKVYDGAGFSNTATVTVNITPVNDIPLSDNSSILVNEDTLYSGSVSGSDIEGSTLTYTVVSNVTHGVLTLNTNGTYTYQPAQNYVGPDSFTFRTNDGSLNSLTATVSITVNSHNNLPVASNNSITTNEDTVYNGNLVATDADNDSLTYSIVANGVKGTVVITNAATGSFTYTPSLNANGSDAFTFRVYDGVGYSNTATVSVTINAINDAPVAVGDIYTTNRNQSKNIVLAGTDVENSNLSYTVVTQPTKGTLSGTPPLLVYTPNLNQTGADSFTFKVNDGQLDSTPATINLTINNTNQLPVANNSSFTTNEDTVKVGNVTATDGDNDPLTYSVVTQPSKGTVTMGTDGSYTFTPTLNANGTDSFTFRTNDGYGNSNTATVSITITPVNDAPVANNLSVSTKQNTAVSFIVTGSDVDGNPLTYTLLTNPTKGVLSGTIPNLTYTPTTNLKGADSFTFRVNDGTVNSTTATVSINIIDVGNWFNTNWSNRRKFVLNNSSNGALSNFPVMIKIDSTRIDYSKTKAAGADIRFTDSVGNLLDYEIERWNNTGTSTVWVKVSSVAASSNSGFIYMYYGNASAVDAQNKTGVWSNGYAAVYHMEETTGYPQDSTSNINHMTSSGGTLNMNVSGKIAGGEQFSTNNAFYKAPSSNWNFCSSENATCSFTGTKLVKYGTTNSFVVRELTGGTSCNNTTFTDPSPGDAKSCWIKNTTDPLGFDITGKLTMEMWVYQTTTGANKAALTKQSSGSSSEWGFFFNYGKPAIYIQGSSQLEFTNAIANNTWTYVASTYNATSNTCALYSSAADLSKTGVCNPDITVTTGSLRLANNWGETSGFNGTLDEVRISNVERSADWISVQIKSGNDTYLTYGAEQNQDNATTF